MSENNLIVNEQTGEILSNEIVVKDTPEYTIYKQPNGKFRREMKYERIFTYVPETREEQIELYKILNTEDHPKVKPMSENKDKIIDVVQFFTNPYSSFNEETGQTENGVTTTIFDGNDYYATSSKTVYYSIKNITDSFGRPNTPDYQTLKVKITGTKRQNGVQINVELA